MNLWGRILDKLNKKDKIRQQEEQRILEELRQRQLEEQRKLEELRQIQQEERRKLEELRQRQQEEQKKLEELRQQEEQRKLEELRQRQQEEQRKLKELRQQEEKRKLEELRQREELTESNNYRGCINKEQVEYQNNLNVEDDYLIKGYGEISTVFYTEYQENSMNFDTEYEQERIPDRFYEEMFEIYFNNDEDEIYKEQREYEQNIDAEYELDQLMKEYQKDLSLIEPEYEQEEEQEDEIIDIDFAYYYRYYFEEDDCTCDINLMHFLRDYFEDNDEYDCLFDLSEDFMFPLHMYLQMCRIYHLDSSAFIVPEIVEGVSFLGQTAECIKINDISLVRMDDKFFESFVEYVCITEQRYNDIISEMIAEEFEREKIDETSGRGYQISVT